MPCPEGLHEGHLDGKCLLDIGSQVIAQFLHRCHSPAQLRRRDGLRKELRGYHVLREVKAAVSGLLSQRVSKPGYQDLQHLSTAGKVT